MNILKKLFGKSVESKEEEIERIIRECGLKVDRSKSQIKISTENSIEEYFEVVFAEKEERYYLGNTRTVGVGLRYNWKSPEQSPEYNPLIYDTILGHRDSLQNNSYNSTYPCGWWGFDWDIMKFFYRSGEFIGVSGMVKCGGWAANSTELYNLSPISEVIVKLEPLLRVAEHLSGRKVVNRKNAK